MNDEILKRQLRRIAIDKQCSCFGCGFEHRCDTEGCAIIRKALERLTPETPNEPLTKEELKGMAGGWVWVVVQYEHCQCEGWGFIPTPAFVAYLDQTLPTDFYGKKYVAYRRKPEDVSKLDTSPGPQI